VSYYHDDPSQELSPAKKFLPGFLVLILLVVLGGSFVKSTLAANITLSSGRSIEFGQSVSQAVACSGSQDVTVTPNSTFVNATNGTGTHNLGSITVSNIPSSCNGVDFILNAYDATSSTPLALFNSTSTDAVVWNKAGTFRVGSGGTGMSVSSSSGKFTVTFTNPVALSSSVFKVTIQSVGHKDFACALGGDCAIGETGPGGGKIFYASAQGFACGVTRAATCNYLEVAPLNWNGVTDPTRTWAQSTPIDYTNTSLLLSQSLGYGAQNTKAIIDQGNSNTATSAAALAASYSPVVNGVTINDWFLPSEDDWLEIYAQRTIIGWNGPGVRYWTSSSVAQDNGRYHIFSGTGVGGAAGLGKGTSQYVRPARAF
jgi:hypothetical protein